MGLGVILLATASPEAWAQNQAAQPQAAQPQAAQPGAEPARHSAPPKGFGLPAPSGRVTQPTPQGPPIVAPFPLSTGAQPEPPGYRPTRRSGEAPPASPQGGGAPVNAAPIPAKPGASLAPRPAPPPVILSQDPRPTLEPGTFVAITRAAERYLAIAEAGGWPNLPKGTSLKPGDKGPEVATLRRRLAVEGDIAVEGEPSPEFDGALSEALRRFQIRHGLAETGAVGPRTLAALNVPAAERHRQLARSAQRLLGTSFPFGERYAVVNIPSAAVEAVEGGQVRRRYTAVVGKRDRQTPQLMARITNVNLNPTWTVPVSLIKKDIIPHMRKDPGYLAKMHIRVLDGHGAEIDPGRIDWTTNKAANYTLRQDPGADNSLGQIRIDMPNRHAIYLHDTPSKTLFARDARFHSSGCVRVADVKAFAEWLLADTLGPNGPWREADIEAGIATGAREDLKLVRPVPVAVVYLTGYATPDGVAHFREDVYGLDREPGPEDQAPAVAAAPEPVQTGTLKAQPAKPPTSTPAPAPRPPATPPGHQAAR